MECYSLKPFICDYKNIIIDEIALNGLEGIGFDFLWKMVEKRISAPVTDKMKNRFWNFIVDCDGVTLYKLPEPLPRLEILNRLDLIDEDSGYVKDTPDYLDGPYEYCPIENEYGSCSNYTIRKLISKDDLSNSSYNKVEEKYGDYLVMVASLEERWKSLAPHASISLLEHMTPVHYCILELVGKSRENGQTSIGKTNLIKIYKDSKLLFYNRKFLCSLDLIQVVKLPIVYNKRAAKSLLLRLKRFHKPSILSLPSKGCIRNIIDHLSKKPDHTEQVNEMLTNGLLNPVLVKKLRKHDKRFQIEVKPLENPQERDSKFKIAARRYISLNTFSDDDSGLSDEEPQQTTIPSQYNVKIPIMRQAHECFIRAGLKGLTQYELAQVLTVEFYTARQICRVFKNKNLVRVFLEDKGKQRSKRYISVTATSEMDVKFEEERKKYIQYSNEIKNIEETMKNEEINTDKQTGAEDTEVPAKKMKLEGDETSSQQLMDYKNYLQQVIEINLIEGLDEKEDLSPLFESNKPPTLRQLKFVNGILKVLTDKKCITGYQNLNSLVAKEIAEPPMDTKRLKYVLQRLLSDKKLRIYKMLRPGRKDVHDTLICVTSVKPTDPLLKAKYKELSTRAINNTKFLKNKSSHGTSGPNLAQYSYPKYMKIRKLHEFIVNFVYFDQCENKDSDLPEGFSSLVQLIPEFTVEFALGNISSSAMSSIPTKKIIDDMLKMKLREVPENIANAFVLSSSLQLSIRTGLRILAMFGLIQLIKEPSPLYDENIVLSYIFYVNRNAKILNTKGKWPRENVDEEALTKSYYFETFEDVKKYWKDVYEISTKTCIELSSRPVNKIVSPVRTMEEVASCDNGQRFGDGLGACGYDSMFYLEMARFWSTFYFKQKKSSSQLVQKKLPQKSIKIPKKEPKQPKVKKPVIKRNRKPIQKIKTAPKPLLKRIRVKPDSSIIWRPEEDKILMYCKIAITIMSPTTMPGILRLKNSVAKDILSLNDPKKDGQTVHKRSIVIESNSKLMYEKECILAELQRRKNLIQKYEGLFKTVRVQTTGSLSKFLLAGRKPMLELVYLINKLVKSSSYRGHKPCVALDYEDFHKNYTLTTNPIHTDVSTYNRIPEECDSNIATVKEAIILALMTSYKRELLPETAEKIHDMLNVFSESQLRLAVGQLRGCGAVAAKDKMFNNHTNRYNHRGSLVQKSYRISANYDRKLMNRLNSEFCQELFNYVYETPTANGLKGSPGLNCLICELLASDKIEIFSVTAPAVSTNLGDIIDDQNATELENKLNLKAGICGWKSKGYDIKLSQLYSELQPEKEIELSKIFGFSSCKTEQIDDASLELIVIHLKEKKEEGSSFFNIQEMTGYDTKTLCEKLSLLESQNIVQLVGFHENIIVLTENIKPWTALVNKTRCIPLPWLSFDGIRYDVLLKWASTIMNKVFEYPGFSITHLALFCELLTPRSIQEICVFLKKYKCVSLKVIVTDEPGLFSDDETVPELIDFYKYASMRNILVFPSKDALTRFSYVKKVILDKVTNKV